MEKWILGSVLFYAATLCGFGLTGVGKIGALLCYVCNSGTPGDEKCSTIRSWESEISRFSKNCSSFQDFIDLRKSDDEMTVSTEPTTGSPVLVAEPDWIVAPKANYQNVCKLIITNARIEEPPGFKGNKTKRLPTRYIRYCSWEATDGDSLETCKKPSVSRRFEVSACTCHDTDHCNGAKGFRVGTLNRAHLLTLVSLGTLTFCIDN